MKVEILVTGPELVGKGIRGIEPVIEEIINEASSEIHIMVYLLKPSALKILKLLERAAERGVRVSMVINNLGIQDPRVVAMLRSIAQRFPHFKVVDFRDPRGAQLHAKVIVADRKRAVVGSANLSWGGMYSNYEVGLLIEGEPAWQLSAIIDYLEKRATSSSNTDLQLTNYQ